MTLKTGDSGNFDDLNNINVNLPPIIPPENKSLEAPNNSEDISKIAKQSIKKDIPPEVKRLRDAIKIKEEILSLGGKGDLLDRYAINSPESPELRPVLNWFNSLIVKIRRLFGISTDKEARISINQGLLGSVLRASPEVADCPQSVALDYMRRHYEQKVELIARDPNRAEEKKNDEALVKRLDFALGISREMERLQKVDKLSGVNSELEKVVEAIEKKIDQMAPGEKMLVPSGWFKTETKFCDALLEITKNDNGNSYDVRMVSLDQDLQGFFAGQKDMRTGKEKHVPFIDFKGVALQDLKSSLSPLLQVQLPHIHRIEEKERGAIGKVSKVLQIMISGDSKTGKNEINLLRLLSNTLGVEGAVPEVTPEKLMSLNGSSTRMRTMMAYMKASDRSHYKDNKLELELRTFNDVLEQSGDLLSQSSILRNECYDAGRRLLHRLEKKLQPLTQEQKELSPDSVEGVELFESRKVIGIQIDKLKANLSALHMNEMQQQEIHTLDEWKMGEFKDKFRAVPPVNLAELSEVDATTSVKAPLALELAAMNPANFGEFMKGLQANIQACQKLYNEADFENLGKLTDMLIAQLPVPSSDTNYIKNTHFTANEAQVLGDNIYKLSQFVFEAQRISDPFNVHPESLLNYAKLQAISDKVMCSGSELVISKYYLDPSPILDFIKDDHYFRITDPVKHQEAEKLVQYWDEQQRNGRKKICLDNRADCEQALLIKMNQSNDQSYTNSAPFKHYVAQMGDNEPNFIFAILKNQPDCTLPEIWSGEGAVFKIPTFIQQQRKMRVLANVMAYKGNNLHASETDDMKIAAKMYQDIGDKEITQQQAWRETHKNLSHLVEKKMRDPLPIGRDSNRLLTEPAFDYSSAKVSLAGELKYSKDILDRYELWHGKQELFKGEGRNISDEVHNQVINFALHTENAKNGSKLTQQSVMQEDTSATIKELRAIQAGDSRLEQTIAVFMKHPEYFNDSSLLRVFECNFFAQGALFKMIRNQPELVKQLSVFFEQNYKLAADFGNVKSALVYLDLQIKLEGFIAAAGLDIEGQRPFTGLFPAVGEKKIRYQNLIKNSKTPVESRAALAGNIIFQANLMRQGKKNISESIISDFLKMKQLPGIGNEINPATEREIENHIKMLMPDLKGILDGETNAQKVKDIFGQLGVLQAYMQNHRVKGVMPVYTLGDYSIDLNKGMLFYKGVTQANMPDDKDLNAILTKISKAASGSLCDIEFRTDKDGSVFAIYSPQNDLSLRVICRPDKAYVVQKKMTDPTSLFGKKSWYEFTTFADPKIDAKGNDLQSQLPLGVGTLLYNNPTWTKVSDPSSIIVTEASSGKAEYAVSLNPVGSEYSLKEVVRLRDGAYLMNPWETPQEVLGQLIGIEDTSHILVWGNGKEPVEVNFPRLVMGDGKPLRYSITFTGDHVPILQSKSFEGYEMALQRPFMGTRGLEGGDNDFRDLNVDLLPLTFANFQLLDNLKADKRKVIIPLQELLPFKPGIGESGNRSANKISGSFNRAWNDRKPADIFPQKILVFDINESRRTLDIASQDKEGPAMMAYIHFAHKSYEGAFQYLEKSRTNLAMKDDHLNIHKWIQKWPDNSPSAVAFKLKAGIMMEEWRSENAGRKESSMEQEILRVSHMQDMYKEYDRIKGSLPATMQLTPKELAVFNNLTEMSILNIMPRQSKESTKAIVPKSMDFSSLPDKLDEETVKNAVMQLWFNVGTESKKLSPSQDFTVTSNERLVKGFEVIYKEIYASEITSEVFKKYKKEIQMASPANQTAQTFQTLLLALIKLKEENASLVELAWPAEWKTNFLEQFEFVRTAGAWNEANGALDSVLQKLNNTLKAKAGAVSSAKEGNPLTEVMQGRELDTKIMTDEKTKYAREMGEALGSGPIKGLMSRKAALTATAKERGERLNEAKSEIEKGQLEDAFENLERTGKLKQIALDRRLEKLELRKAGIDKHLRAKKVKKDEVVPQGDKRLVQHKKESRILGISAGATFSLFNEEAVKTRCGQAQDLEFLRTAHQDGAAKRLASEICKDTEFAIDKAGNEKKYKFAGAEEIQVLKKAALEERGRIENGIKTAGRGQLKHEKGLLELERKLMTAITTGRREQSILQPLSAQLPERLIGLYTEGHIDAHSLKKNFGISISEEGAKEIDDLIEKYMVLSISNKAVKALLEALDKLPENPDDITPEMTDEIFKLVDKRRYFDIPGPFARDLLTIEYINGYTLHAPQAATIESMLKGTETKDKSGQIRQLLMGGGKSSVLLPTLLRKFADGEHLAVGLIPEWMWEIVCKDLDQSSRNLFGQKIHLFEFDRNTNISREWLLEKYVQLGSCIVNQEAVLTTKTSLLSFRNKFIETMHELESAPAEKRAEIEGKLELMAEILTLFKTHSKVIADEVDSILSVRRELNYSIGKPTTLEPIMNEMGVEIYSKLAAWADPGNMLKPEETDLKSFAKIFMLNGQAGMSKEMKDKARQQLAREFYAQWKNDLTSVDEALFINYVTGGTLSEDQIGDNRMPDFMNQLKESKATLDGVDGAIAAFDTIATLRQFLSGAVATALDTSNNVSYGRGEDGENTIPYVASNTPADAEFGDTAERIVYFCQDYMQSGISDKQTEQYVENLQRKIEQEMQEVRVTEGRLGDFSNMETAKRFQREYGEIDLLKAFKDPAERNKLSLLINANDTSKMQYLKRWVLPNVEIASTQVSSNGNDLVDMLGEFNGFTGTPSNLDACHDKIDTSKAIEAGTDGKSIEFLIAMSKQLDSNGKALCNVLEVKLNPVDPLGSISEIDGFFDRYRALIDAGAYMKGINNADIAGQLSQKMPAAFIDGNDKMLMEHGKPFALGSRADVSADSRFTYYDQAHTTGVDIGQGKQARAVVTIGENLHIRDLLQAIWRMRKIDQGQHIDFLVSDDVKKIINKTFNKDENDAVTVEDIINFCISNQAKDISRDVFSAEQQKISGNVPQAMFWQLVYLCRGGEEQKTFAKTLFNEVYSSYLLKETKDDMDSFAAVEGKAPSAEVLEKQKKQKVAKFKESMVKAQKLDKNNMYKIKQDLEKHILATDKRAVAPANKLPVESSIMPATNKGSQVQTQRQQQQQQQISVQKSLKKTQPDMDVRWSGWDPVPKMPMDLWSAFGTWKQLDIANSEKTSSKGFDQNISFSPNFVSGIGAENNADIIRQKLLAKDRNQVGQVVIMRRKSGDGFEWKAALIDVLEYEKIVRPILDKFKGDPLYEAVVFDVRPSDASLRLATTVKGNIYPEAWEGQAEGHKLLAQAKFFGGEFNFFDKEERAGLDAWLETVDKSAFKKMFEGAILKTEDVERYKNSYLAKKFNEQNI